MCGHHGGAASRSRLRCGQKPYTLDEFYVLRGRPRRSEPVGVKAPRVTNTRGEEDKMNIKPRSVTPLVRHIRGVEIYFVYRRRR